MDFLWNHLSMHALNCGSILVYVFLSVFLPLVLDIASFSFMDVIITPFSLSLHFNGLFPGEHGLAGVY